MNTSNHTENGSKAPDESSPPHREVESEGPRRPVAQEPTVGEVGEDPLVADLITRYPGADWLNVGPGDDAAVLDLAPRFPGRLVVCTDTLVEDQDFRRDWSSARDVGIKTAAQNFADVAAMGGRPHALLVSLTTPGDLPASWAAELADGLAQECARAGAVVAGGDVSAGVQLVVTGTAIGTLVTPAAVLRSGARAGDILAIAGVSGRAAGGWALLRHGLAGSANPVLAPLIADQRRPRPPYLAGPAAALGGATAMIDTSDGLARDAARLALASGVQLDLDPSCLQPDSEMLSAAAVLMTVGAPAAEADPYNWVLTGGEDHALLACFPPGTALPAPFRQIGQALPRSADAPLVTLAGAPIPANTGWHHWA
jgi:thiamine-monophosphate kinase